MKTYQHKNHTSSPTEACFLIHTVHPHSDNGQMQTKRDKRPAGGSRAGLGMVSAHSCDW